MRSHFRGHYSLNEKEKASLWKNGLIVLDANILLNLYRYTGETSKQLISILRAHSDRIWIPHRVAFEYHKNRINVIEEQIRLYTTLKDNFTKFRGTIISGINRHPFLRGHDFKQKLNNTFDEIDQEIKRYETQHPDLLSNDHFKEELAELFENRVGGPYSSSEYDALKREAEERLSRKIPPGYRDSKEKTDEADKIGDYVIWRQLIDKAKADNCPVIFVSDDNKDDWWLISSGRTLGPRPELIEEFYKETNNHFYIYSSGRFMEFASAYLDSPLTQEAIEEANLLSEQRSGASHQITYTTPEVRYSPDAISRLKSLPEEQKAYLRPIALDLHKTIERDLGKENISDDKLIRVSTVYGAFFVIYHSMADYYQIIDFEPHSEVTSRLPLESQDDGVMDF